MQYHIGPNGPGRCGAQVACPFQPGGSRDDGLLASIPGVSADYHFGSQEEAQKAYEKKLGVQYTGSAPGFNQELKKARQRNKSSRQEHYRNLDYSRVLQANGRPLQASLVRHAIAGRRARRAARLSGKVLAGGVKLAMRSVNTVTRTVTGRRSRGLNMKKLLLTKYWMPNIRSNKWR